MPKEQKMNVRDQYYDLIQHKAVLAVEAEHTLPNIPSRAQFGKIHFYVEGYRFALTTNIDTDEIIMAVEPSSRATATDLNLHPVLGELVGREFGWIWYTTNVQGYDDMLIFAFRGAGGGGITPQLAFLVEASDIKVLRIVGG
jgi:hypothetical protein